MKISNKSILTAVGSFVLFSVVFLFAGCIKESNISCERAYIHFSYTGDGEDEILCEKIEEIELYIFDEAHKYVGARIVNKDHLIREQGVRLDLRPGRYKIVCIGNVFEHTLIHHPELIHFDEIRIAHPHAFEQKEIPTNDSLYFGSCLIDIPGNSEYRRIEETVSFVSSHLKIFIEVFGVPVEESKGEGEVSQVRIVGRQLSAQVDFSNRTCGDKFNYHPEIHRDEGVKGNDYFYSRFNILRHTPTCGVCFELVDGEDNVIHCVDLRDFLSQYPEIDLDKNEVFIPISIRFEGYEVKVSVPDWYIREIEPEF